jgi:hypothetical protein
MIYGPVDYWFRRRLYRASFMPRPHLATTFFLFVFSRFHATFLHTASYRSFICGWRSVLTQDVGGGEGLQSNGKLY